jgi:hypothetical protein
MARRQLVIRRACRLILNTNKQSPAASMTWFSDVSPSLETEVLIRLSNILTGGKLSILSGGPSLVASDVALCADGSVAHPPSTAATSAPMQASVRGIALPLWNDPAKLLITFNAPSDQSAGFEVEFSKEDALSESVLVLGIAVCQGQRFGFRLSVTPIPIAALTNLGILRIDKSFMRDEKGCPVKYRSSDGSDS